MIPAERQREVLSSDPALLDLSSQREARPGLWIVSCPGELMPDGHSFEWQHKGELNLETLQRYCNAAREAWNERTHGKTASELSKGAARIPDAPRDDTPTGESGASGVPEAQDVQRPQGTLEEYLLSQVDHHRSRLDALKAERDGIESRIASEETMLLEASAAYEGFINVRRKDDE